MSQVLTFINGKKTYITAAGFIALGVYQILHGQQDAGVQHILSGGALIGLGHKLDKSAKGS